MFQIIEHLIDPWDTLQAAAESLLPGGVLVVATPNPGAFQFRFLRGRWTHVDAPRHTALIPSRGSVRSPPSAWPIAGPRYDQGREQPRLELVRMAESRSRTCSRTELGGASAYWREPCWPGCSVPSTAERASAPATQRSIAKSSDASPLAPGKSREHGLLASSRVLELTCPIVADE